MWLPRPLAVPLPLLLPLLPRTRTYTSTHTATPTPTPNVPARSVVWFLPGAALVGFFTPTFTSVDEVGPGSPHNNPNPNPNPKVP